MLIAQLSDPHIWPAGGGPEKAAHTANLRQAVRQVNALRPDCVLLTGDLVNAGSEDEYAALVEALAPLDAPVYPLPGNHDDRGAFRAAFPGRPELGRDGFIQYAVEDFPLRILVADTLVPGAAGGELCGERLDWLAARLGEAPVRPTLIALHHPPFETGIAAMDAIGLEGAAALAGIVARHAQVEAVVAGHLHRHIVHRFANCVAMTAPSTAFLLALDLEPKATLGRSAEPAAFLLHRWRADSGLVTHVCPLGDFGYEKV